MFLSLKQSGLGGAPVLATACFAAGLTAGAWLAPLNASRSIETAAAAAPAKMVMPATLRGGHPAEVLRGDTFEARVKIWPGMEITTRVRLRGIDAPELKARCGEEYAKAQSAREALAAMLAEGDVRVGNVGLDKYGGRVLADASTRSTPDVSRALLGAGLARSYSGGKRETWCQ